MTVEKNILENLATNWDNISAKVKKHWDKLSDDQLKEIEGSYDNLVASLKDAYGYTARAAKAEVDEFLEKINESTYQMVKDNIQHVGESLYEYKDKITECEKHAAQYIRKNPLKSVGVALAAGFVVSRILSLIS